MRTQHKDRVKVLILTEAEVQELRAESWSETNINLRAVSEVQASDTKSQNNSESWKHKESATRGVRDDLTKNTRK